MPEGISSLFAAIAATAQPPTLPAPEGDRPVVATPTSRSIIPDVKPKQQQQSPSKQEATSEQEPGLPPIPDVEIEVLTQTADTPGVGVYTAVDAEAASEIAQAINSGMIQRGDAGPAPFLPLRDRWVWSSVALAAFVSAVLIAEGPAAERGTTEYIWWLVGTSLGSFPVAFGVGLLTAWIARLSKVQSAGALRMSFAAGSIGLFLGLAMVAEHFVNEYNTPKQVVTYTPPPKPKVVIVAKDPAAAVHAPVTQEKAIDTVKERNEQQVSVIAAAMRTLVDELQEELEDRNRRMGKDPVKSLLATSNFLNSKNFSEGKKRIEVFKRISEDYEQRILARYDHFPPRLRALEIPNEAKKQLIQAFERSRIANIGKLREAIMLDRAVLGEVRELYAFIQSRVGKFSVSTQLWFRDPKDAAIYNGFVKRINDLNQQQQRATQQLHGESFAKLTELGKEVQWASLD